MNFVVYVYNAIIYLFYIYDIHFKGSIIYLLYIKIMNINVLFKTFNVYLHSIVCFISIIPL